MSEKPNVKQEKFNRGQFWKHVFWTILLLTLAPLGVAGYLHYLQWLKDSLY
jgi:hypothetical protein